MLRAAAEDFAGLPAVETVTLATTDVQAFRVCAHEADFTLVIAPETNGILAERCRWVEEVRGNLLGPSSGAVTLTGDKQALWEHWRKQGVPTPECGLPLSGREPATMFWPVVCKPRHGAGSQATFLVHNRDELAKCLEQAQQEGCDDAMVVQPFVPGLPASIAWLIGRRNRRLLLAAQQTLSRDGRFHYQGGLLPLSAELTERAVRLSDKALAGIDGLLGYVGVDLILGGAADGSQDFAIEINPRLTTSYIGLRKLARDNLAGAMIAAASGDILGELCWREGSVSFTADGRVVET